MIALYLLAAHLVGDFLLQTRWQAEGKFDDAALRLRHVLSYMLPFIPVAIAVAPTWNQVIAGLVILFVLHFATDSRRFLSTPGEWLVWNRYRWDRMEPNPWPAMPLLIDQALHVCQLALVGYILTA